MSNKNAKPKDHVEIGVDAEDYYGGVIIVLGAGILLVTRRRMNTK